MGRKYDISLVERIRRKQYETMYRGVWLTMKPIPDCDLEGAMDPRVLERNKSVARLTRFIPKRLISMSSLPIIKDKILEGFNSVNSQPLVEGGITKEIIRVESFDGYAMPVSIFRPENPKPDCACFYYIHGGGFVAGHTEVVEDALKLFVKQTGMIAVSVDYRLVPKHPFPTGHQDCFEGLMWLVGHANEKGISPKNIFVGGDSAGGNLALYCANRCIQENIHVIAGLILLYPTVNMMKLKDDYTRYTIDDLPVYEPQRGLIQPLFEMYEAGGDALFSYLGEAHHGSIELSPYQSVSSLMPPTFLATGEHDYLSFEALAYMRKLQDLQVDTSVYLYKGLGHAFIDEIGNYPQAEDCVFEIAQFIEKHVKKTRR